MTCGSIDISFNVVETTCTSKINYNAKKYVNENIFPQITLDKDVLNINGIIKDYNDVLTITGNNIEQVTAGEYIWTRKINSRTKC